jgi:hypothetical protein
MGCLTLIAVPLQEGSAISECIWRLRRSQQLQVTVLNFANEPIAGSVRSEKLPSGSAVSDMFTGQPPATVDDLHSFALELDSHRGMSLLLVRTPTPDSPED